MMYKNAMFIKFRSREEYNEAMMAAMRALDKGDISGHETSENVIYFHSIKDYEKFMTKQKLAILSVIQDRKFKSIYELSKILGRERSAVTEDCNKLEALRFIDLVPIESEYDNVKRVRPEAIFPFDKIIIDLENEPSFKKGIRKGGKRFLVEMLPFSTDEESEIKKRLIDYSEGSPNKAA